MLHLRIRNRDRRIYTEEKIRGYTPFKSSNFTDVAWHY